MACPWHRPQCGACFLACRDPSGLVRSQHPLFACTVCAVQGGTAPVELSCRLQALQQHLVQGCPYPCLVPVAQASPATHAGAASHLGWQHLPWQTRLQHEQDARQSRAVRQARPAALRFRRLRRQERRDRRPQIVGNKRSGHASHNAPEPVSLCALNALLAYYRQRPLRLITTGHRLRN